ncbi:MAG: biotin--[acetyl-CoA-carboxylase] ligase [Lachnospiraceae bacterium]|jgi:BirA family biotin operon repressor/biotin-[acetyl-CoA-carboxylase] ligase|nr:biotin--[acetyl-CoA-carboxylase] ligase [Lachnospiraceae bacterium]
MRYNEDTSSNEMCDALGQQSKQESAAVRQMSKQESATVRQFGDEILYFEQLDSTSTYAKQLADKGAQDKTVVLARMQTAGRGRFGRRWESQADKTLTFSVILRPNLSTAAASMLPLVFSLSIAESIQPLTDSLVQIKWPNDILLNRRKVCGILLELITHENQMQYIIVGIGINLRKWDTDMELGAKMTSLEEHHIDIDDLQNDLMQRQILADSHSSTESSTSLPPLSFLRSILHNIEKNYTQFLSNATQGLGKLKDAYERFLINLDCYVRIIDAKDTYTGIARGINMQGELLVEDEEGNLHNVYAGEVSVRGIDGYVS